MSTFLIVKLFRVYRKNHINIYSCYKLKNVKFLLSYNHNLYTNYISSVSDPFKKKKNEEESFLRVFSIGMKTSSMGIGRKR